MNKSDEAFIKWCKNIARINPLDYSCCVDKGMENCASCFGQDKSAWRASRKQAMDEFLEILIDRFEEGMKIPTNSMRYMGYAIDEIKQLMEK